MPSANKAKSEDTDDAQSFINPAKSIPGLIAYQYGKNQSFVKKFANALMTLITKFGGMLIRQIFKAIARVSKSDIGLKREHVF